MIYFKDLAVPPSKIDANQLELVRTFKTQLSDLGGYYWNYSHLKDFEKFVRMHLSMQVLRDTSIINKTLQFDDAKLETPKSDDQVVKKIIFEPDEGFFDLMQKGIENFELNTKVTNTITNLMEEITDKTSQHTVKLNKLGVAKNTLEIEKVKQIIDSFSKDMDGFSNRLDTKRHSFYNNYTNGMEACGRAMLLLPDFGDNSKEELKTFLKSVTFVKSSLKSMKTSFGNFRNVVASMPRVTTSFSKSRRRMLDTISTFINDLESAIILTSELENSLKSVIS